MTTHGGRANKTGKTLESIVVPALTSQYGFEVWKHKKYKAASHHKPDLLNPPELPKRLLIKHFPYTTLYGSNGKTEFLLNAEDANSTPEFPVLNPPNKLVCRIECKWQQTAGSVDEKFPYLYLSCIEAMPETNIIILYGGGKFRIGAIKWLKDAIATKKYFTNSTPPDKKIVAMSIEEFLTWVNHAFDKYAPA
jgi:hypothetical protein